MSCLNENIEKPAVHKKLRAFQQKGFERGEIEKRIYAERKRLTASTSIP